VRTAVVSTFARSSIDTTPSPDVPKVEAFAAMASKNSGVPSVPS
jgi:hypothetical protein